MVFCMFVPILFCLTFLGSESGCLDYEKRTSGSRTIAQHISNRSRSSLNFSAMFFVFWHPVQILVTLEGVGMGLKPGGCSYLPCALSAWW